MGEQHRHDSNNAGNDDGHDDDDEEVDDPVRRLVAALVGVSNHGGGSDGDGIDQALSLARRVLGSHIGATAHNNNTNNSNNEQQQRRIRQEADLSAMWRRISRRGSDPKAREDVERLYRLYEMETSPSSSSSRDGHPADMDSDIPPKLLAGEW
jgi:hypothetical protein